MIPKIKLIIHPETGGLIQEQWKYIEGFKQKYLISNYGRVKSFNTGYEKLLKPETLKKGYLRVCLSLNNKCCHWQVHRLVAKVFIGDSKMVVNHKDFNKKNNFYLNLEYTTNRGNTIHYRKSLKRELPIGVRVMKKKFQARLNIGKKVIYLGVYDTPKEAGEVYQKALMNIV